MKYLLPGTLALTALIPAIFNFGFEQIKVIFFLFAASFVSLFWVFKKGNAEKLKWTNLKIASTVFISTLFLTSLTGLDPKFSFLGKDPYFQGFFVYEYLFLFSLMISSLKINTKHVIFPLSLSSFLISMVAIFQALQLYILDIDIPNYAGRVVSTFGQPNLYSGFLVMSIPFIYLGIKNLKWRKFYLFTLLLSISGIIISASRASILILVVLALLWSVYKFKNARVAITIVALTVAILAVYLLKVEIVSLQDVQWLSHNAPEKRIIFWPVLLEQYSRSWIQGYGLENIDIAYESFEKFHGERTPAYYSLKDLTIDRAHNYILDLLLFGGILVFFPWIFLIWNMFKKAKGTFLLIPLAVYLLWIQFQIQGIVHLLYFWLLVGLIDQESY